MDTFEKWLALARKRLPTPIDKILNIAGLSDHFISLCNNRMIMGHFRYGFITKNTLTTEEWIEYITGRLQSYKKTGNTENLIDATNGCWILFQFTKHQKKHFKAIDDKEHNKNVRL